MDRKRALADRTASNRRDVADRVEAASRLARHVVQADESRLTADRERRLLEDRLGQSERLESLGQLAGGIAHDFNNLLGVILNYAELVIEETEGIPQARADATQIQAAAERAAALTRQLLIFARRQTIQLAPLDLNAVVADIEDMLSRSIGEHVDLVVQQGRAVPVIHADRGQIEQVLVNLAVNARDAMAGGGTLTIGTGMADLDEHYTQLHPNIQPGCYAELTVSDTGMGMTAEVAGHIFETVFHDETSG